MTKIVDSSMAMGDIAKTSLVEIINRSLTGIDNAVSFLSVQIPDVIRQLLIWEATKSAIWFVFGLAFFVVSSVYFIKALKGKWNDKHGDPFGSIMAGLCAGSCMFMFGCIMGAHMVWLKIILAPKLYLIQYAIDMAKDIKGN